MYCGLCNEHFLSKDAKEHKNKNTHLIKKDVIKEIKELDLNNEKEKKIMNNLFKTLTPKYKNKIGNTNTVD